MKTERDQIPPYTTKDGSEIRELLHPSVHGNRGQSLAEARLAPGVATSLHRHVSAEEIYHFLAGHGVMTLGNQRFAVKPGDSVCIPPGTPHCLHNTGADTLVLLCCCAPPYTHGDTELLT